MPKEKEGSKIHTLLKGPSSGYTDNLPNREMWEAIAKDLNGKFIIRHDTGKTIEMHHIVIPHKQWDINISVSDSRPLKFQISFSASQDFAMTLSREDLFDRMVMKFRKTKIKVGWKEFDRHYLIKSKRSDLIKKTISTEMQKSLLKHNVFSLSYQTKIKSRRAELISVIQRKAGSKEMNVELIEMFKRLIDNFKEARIIK